MGGLFSSLIHLIILTVILGIFIADIVLWRLVVCTLVICLLSIYIVWDTQMIVGGKGKHQAHQFDLDDYVIAAILLYSDIIQVFLCVLQLLGGGNN